MDETLKLLQTFFCCTNNKSNVDLFLREEIIFKTGRSTSCHSLSLSLSNTISGLPVRAEGQPGLPPGLSACPRRTGLLPVRPVPVRGPVEGQDGHPGDHQHLEGLAAGAPEEPVPHQRREDHAGHHHSHDAHTGGCAPPPCALWCAPEEELLSKTSVILITSCECRSSLNCLI